MAPDTADTAGASDLHASWTTLSVAVSKQDRDTVEDIKEDIDTLLVFVSRVLLVRANPDTAY
jgi:hypothetical protein